MPFFDAEYLRNSTIYSTIYRQFQWNTIGTYTRPYTQHCRFEWPWVTEQNIQWQEASRGLSAVSLRQLSLLLLLVVSLGQMSITNRSKCPSVRANVAQSARCHDLQNSTAPAPLGSCRRHLARIFYESVDTTSTKNNSSFPRMHRAAPPTNSVCTASRLSQVALLSQRDHAMLRVCQ